MIYLPINKCANTSLKVALAPFPEIIIPSLFQGVANNIQALKKSRVWNQPKFTVIRHPLERFLSAYRMMKELFSIEELITICENPEIGYEVNERGEIGKLEYAKRHTLPMSSPLYGVVEDGKIKADYVFKLEELDLSPIGLNLKIPKLNQTIKDSITLNKEQEKRLREYYKTDFELFDYK